MKPTNEKKIFVLCYHSIQNLGYLHSIHIDVFERQIAYLKKHFQPLSYQDFCAVMEGKMTLAKDGVLATFDDGIEDNFTNAFPILQKHQFPGVVFMTTGLAGQVCDVSQGYALKLLEWKDIQKMEESGLVSIQSHTHTHPYLTQLDSQMITEELGASKNAIASILMHESTAIAYPKNDYDERVIDVIKDFFTYGFEVNGGYFDRTKISPYRIPRILISQDVSMIKFRIIMTKSFWQLRSVYHKILNLIKHT